MAWVEVWVAQGVGVVTADNAAGPAGPTEVFLSVYKQKGAPEGLGRWAWQKPSIQESWFHLQPRAGWVRAEKTRILQELTANGKAKLSEVHQREEKEADLETAWIRTKKTMSLHHQAQRGSSWTAEPGVGWSQSSTSCGHAHAPCLHPSAFLPAKEKY
jgi:hypothetical protein